MGRRRQRRTFSVKAISEFFGNFCNPCRRVRTLSLHPEAAYSKKDVL